MASITVYGILSYPHLTQPRAVNPGDDPKYSAAILIPKGDAQIAVLEATIAADLANAWPSGAPASAKKFLKDGAVAFPNDPAMHNYMIVSANAKADQRPHTVDSAMKPLVDPSKIFAGAMVHAAINTFTYNQPVNKGVSAGLNGVMFTGEVGPLGRLDGRPSVEQMFSGVAGAPAPTAAAPAPAAPTPPTPPVPPASPAPSAVHQMTPAANGVTYEQYQGAGWSDVQLIEAGLMLPPGGVTPSFG